MRFINRSAVLFASLALPLALTTNALADSSCSSVAGNLVANCGFESGDFTGWTMVDASGSTDVDSYNPNTGMYSATLGAYGATAGTLSQTITDVAGQLYSFSFYLENEVAVDLNGNPYPGTDEFAAATVVGSNGATTSFLDASIPQTSFYQLYAYTFVGSGTDTILFTTTNTPSYYELDDVAVNAQNAPTPEPSSLALMGTGAVVFAAYTRRKLKGL